MSHLTAPDQPIQWATLIALPHSCIQTARIHARRGPVHNENVPVERECDEWKHAHAYGLVDFIRVHVLYASPY